MRTSKTVEHMALNCPYYHRNSIIADIVNLALHIAERCR